MKIRPEDYAVLKYHVSYAMTQSRPYCEYKKAGLSDKRYRWDMLRNSGLSIGDGAGMPGDLDLYAYMNDDHIDAALRKITRTK